MPVAQIVQNKFNTVILAALYTVCEVKLIFCEIVQYFLLIIHSCSLELEWKSSTRCLIMSSTRILTFDLSLSLSNHSSNIVEWPSPQPIRRKICRIPLSKVIMTAVWKSQRHPAVRVLQGPVLGPSPYLKTTTSALPQTAASERWNTPRTVRRGGVSPSFLRITPYTLFQINLFRPSTYRRLFLNLFFK